MRWYFPIAFLLFSMGIQPLQAQHLQYIDSEYWNRANDVIAMDSLLYCAYANGIQIIDVSNLSNPVVVSKLFHPGYGYKICKANNLIYLADGRAGIQIIDVSNGSNPQIVGSCSTPGTAVDIILMGNYAYIADSSSGLQIINISNPVAPYIASSLDLTGGGNATSVSVINNIAYIGNNHNAYDQRVTIADISDPSSPTIAGEFSLMSATGYVATIVTIDTVAYIAAGDCYVYNISNLLEPVRLSRVSCEGSLVDLAIRGNLGYGAVYSESSFSNGLIAIDFSDLLHPILLSSIYPAYRIAAVAIRDTCAFIGTRAGIEALDISDDYNISFISRLGSIHDLSDIGIADDYAYIADGEYSNLEIADIGVPSNISPVATMHLPDLAYGISISGDYAYVANYNHGLQIVDIENPQEPVPAGEYIPLPHGWSFCVQTIGNYSYLANFEYGLEIIDVSDPSEPTLTSEFYVGQNTVDHLCLSGNYAYLGSQRVSSLYIVDISNPNSPTPIGVWGQGDVRGISVSGNYVFMAIGTNLVSVDVTDPVHPVTAGELALFGRGSASLEIWENLAIVGSYLEGVKIVDISSPDNMRVVSEFNIPGWTKKIRVFGDYCYLLNTYSLSVFELSSTGIEDSTPISQKYFLSQNYPNPFNAQTTISYSLAEPGPVTLTIYNLLGQKVATLVDGMQTAGEHKMVWDAGNQPSGVYFYRLNGDNFSKSSQMILLR